MARLDNDSPLVGVVTGRRNASLEMIARKITGIQDRNTRGLTTGQKALVLHWADHPWNFLAGEDEDGTPIYFTKDERDSSAPLKPFPIDKPFLKPYIDVLHNERIIFVDKARQMYISTATLGYIAWQCCFQPGRRWILSKSTQEEAVTLLRDKIREPAKHYPDWFAAWAGVSAKPEDRIVWKRAGSTIIAVTENVSDRAARGGTASGVFVDEAAFQTQFGSMLQAMLPMTEKLIAVSTANLGNPGAEEFKRYIRDETEGGR